MCSRPWPRPLGVSLETTLGPPPLCTRRRVAESVPKSGVRVVRNVAPKWEHKARIRTKSGDTGADVVEEVVDPEPVRASNVRPNTTSERHFGRPPDFGTLRATSKATSYKNRWSPNPPTISQTFPEVASGVDCQADNRRSAHGEQIPPDAGRLLRAAAPARPLPNAHRLRRDVLVHLRLRVTGPHATPAVSRNRALTRYKNGHLMSAAL